MGFKPDDNSRLSGYNSIDSYFDSIESINRINVS
jgi:hypothetical protein